MTARSPVRLLLSLLAIGVLCLGVFSHNVRPAHAFTGNFQTHDPSLTKSGSCFYVFSTGANNFNNGNIQIRRSCDFDNWTRLGTVFNSLPSWIPGAIGTTPGNLWAPDINFFNGRWHLYYAASTFGTNRSAIGLATATNIEGPWTDNGEVLRSVTSNNYNAIDPDLIVDQSGNYWLSFGSFWDGIKMRQIDPATGKLLASNTALLSLASRGGGAIEAPSIVHRNGFYYLFVSFDTCCQGSNSTYRIMVGRATSVSGPYFDRNGVNMLNGGGTQILASAGNQRGPGGQDVYLDGTLYRLAHHYYDSNLNGDHRLAAPNLAWSSDNWPTIDTGTGSPTATPTRTATRTNTAPGPTNTPTRTPTQPAGTTVLQAESASFGGGATADSNNAGFNGTGFINFPATGGFVQFNNVGGGTGGSTALQFRYALGAAGSRTGSLIVNGASQPITFNSTGAWATWQVLTVNVSLNAGTGNTLRLESTGQDLANVDQLALSGGTGLTPTRTNTQVGPTNTPTRTATQPPTSQVLQSESASFGGGTASESTNGGFMGSGYVNFPASGGFLQFNNVGGGAGGSTTLQLRYALGITTSRSGLLIVNGASQPITFNPTGAWTAWAVQTVSVSLNAGAGNTLRLESNGQDLANIDQLQVP
jgi:arabinan endo-1,5-alpha-L-arabinosidase